MISPKKIIETLFGVKISRKQDLIINAIILIFILMMFTIVLFF